MALWRRFVSARFDSFINGRKRWYSVLPGSGAPSAGGVVRFRGFMVMEEPFPGGSPMFCYTHLRYFMASGQAKPKPKAEGKGGDWRKPKVENDGGIRINEAINDREVRLVTDQGHRVVSIQEALYLARKLDLDLVEVQRKVKVEGGAQSAVFKPAVCKLMDYCKEKYKQDMKGKERAKSKAAIALRNGENKEVRFKAKTELKDLKIKAESVKRLMERGYRVKCTAMPTGKDDGDLGGLLLNLLSLIEDISIVESGPHLDTKNAYVIVKHIKFGSKKGKKVSKAVETVSSVLSTRSDAAADNNSKDEDDCQTEEEWEAVESDSETEIDNPSKQFKTNTPNLSGSCPTLPPKVVGNGFDEWSGTNTTDDIKAEITFNTKHTSSSVTMSTSEESINTASRRNSAGFYPSQTESYVTETNRYSKGSNSTFHQIRPTNQDRFSPGHVATGNQQRIPERSNRREVERCGQSNPNDRPANSNYYSNSSSSGHGVFSASQSSGSNDRRKAGGATMGSPNAPNVPQQRYGVFSSAKTSSPLDVKNMNEISEDRMSKSNSPTTSNYGIFSVPKTISSEDQMKQRISTRDNSIRVAPGFVDNGKSSNAAPPSPRFGIFTSSKKIPSDEDRVGDKN
ncbi:hypothetical protein KFK09_007859 [Dendrobium nobile]|uniref:Translation initiation factor 3 N-terminal domain-containing protein n=1 Tax=Dendrobium nobile TaxID=94219 RepID=A0A8T3BXR6_DENNO|nr:hypothetical protein KFK09_007859 [Dendrobium nobile]